MSFTLHKKSNPCLVCGKDDGRCKTNESDLIFCMTFLDGGDRVPGRKFAGQTKNGVWGIWAPDDGSQTQQEREEHRRLLEITRRQRKQQEAQRRAAAMPAVERDRYYRQLLAQLDLNPVDRADLHRRGLTDEQIKAAGFKSVEKSQRLEFKLPSSLPGVNEDGRSLTVSDSGYLCPVRDIDGKTIAFQIRLRESDGGGRYRWLSSYSEKYHPNGPDAKLKNGENPLGVYRPEAVKIKAIGLAEGLGLKPLIASERLGQVFIGASGGQFTSSPETFKSYLERLSVELGTKQVIDYPDAGDIINPQVMSRRRHLWELLGNWGYEVKVAWWGQRTKDQDDIDELTSFEDIQYLTVARFKAIAKKIGSKQEAIANIDQKRQQWLNLWEEKLGSLPETEIEREINRRLAANQLLRSPAVEVGDYPDLSYPDYRKMLVLDGQKGTRKTSKALKSLVEDAKAQKKRVLVVVPSRVLAKSAASVLDAVCHLDDEAITANVVVTCPESVWRFASQDWDLLALDEANEDVHRILAGNLGNRPSQSREALIKIIKNAHCVVVSQDSIYSPTINAVQRHGKFNTSQIEVIRRRRKPTEMFIHLYMGGPSQDENWDGIKDEKPKALDLEFYGWLNELIGAVEQGEKVSVPCGSRDKMRQVARLLRSLFPDKKIFAFDGQDSFPKARAALASKPSQWVLDNQPDVLMFTPVLNSGVSVESSYFTTQFEYVSASETASSASQRGERVRAAIGGGLITERHIYIGRHGISLQPEPEIFTTEYWEAVLKGDRETQVKGAQAIAEQLKLSELLEDLRQRESEEVSDLAELPEIMAIHSREVYFKRECLIDEWESNGWEVKPGTPADQDTAKALAQRIGEIKEEIVQQKARTRAKAKAKDIGKDAEPSGPIEAVKVEKFAFTQIFGNYSKLNTPEFWAAWQIETGSSGGIKALQLRVLLSLQQDQPELWCELLRRNTLRLLGSDRRIDQEPGTLPVPPRLIAIAQLLGNCPGIGSVLSGKLQEWNRTTPEVTAAAVWSRVNAVLLAAISRNSQRIHGLQFTESTPDIKCFHKLLEYIGIESKCLGRDGTGDRLWRYRAETVDDIDELLKQKDDPRLARKRYRSETREELQTRILETLNDQMERSTQVWGAYTDALLKEVEGLKNSPSTTSVRKDLLTEVLDEPNLQSQKDISLVVSVDPNAPLPSVLDLLSVWNRTGSIFGNRRIAS